jgi:phosphohistidine swiveling domain-containing protein
MEEKIEFVKDLSRDTTLFMQGVWARAMSQQIKDKFGWENPTLPFVAHYVNDGLVEIWQHKKALQWLMDKLLAEEKNGLEFLENVISEYGILLRKLKEFHTKGSLETRSDINIYVDLVYKGALCGSLFYYVGQDERTSEGARALAVESRKMGDFFADNDFFVRHNIERLGNVSKELAGMVLPDELVNIPAKDVLEKRLKHFLMIDGVKTFDGTLDQFSAANQEYVFAQEVQITEVSELLGQTACPGIARGTVKIVKKQIHLAKVAVGDILVAPMTTPDFLPAMKKAAAFVTDEGGITCHAAIVAREMKKPCIIGTKIATKVFKDGDMIEVDATNGVVRIIEKYARR